ncbi:MAG: S8 family peptidase, partial [Cyclobacteriaceae bacterium]|nr:S8 family peptidase [Cyclobacteriaceae bacterium]
FVLVGLSTSFSQSSSHVPGEVIIRLDIGMMDSTFMFGDLRYTTKPREHIQNTSLDSLFQKETILELRKVMRPLPEAVQNSLRDTKNIKALLDLNSIMVLRLPDETDIPALCKRLNKIKGVVYAEPNWIAKLDNTFPNDTYFSQQSSLYDTQTYADGHINAPRAWDFMVGKPDVRVGVLDSGIDYDNPDLGNGAYAVPDAIIVGGYNYINPGSNPDDDEITFGGHGTKAAGIIGAVRNNGIGVAGIAGGSVLTPVKKKPGVRLYAFKIAASNGSITDLNMATAIAEASIPYYGYGCHILNISGGISSYSEVVRDAIRVANQFGTLIVASKGNDNTTSPHYPADYDKEWVMAVGASDGTGARLFSSNYGGGIDIVAPGWEDMVYTTARVEAGGYGHFGQTSAATPHVAGVAALIKSKNILLHQNDVEGIMKASAKRNPQHYYYVNEYHQEMGSGLLNAGKALEMMNAPWSLAQRTWTGGSIYSSTGQYYMTFLNNGGGPLHGIYQVVKHAVRIAPGTPLYQNNEFYAWGRSVGASTGWSDATTNYQLGFTEVISKSAQSVNLQTYVYQVWTTWGTYLGWYPTTPSNVVFAYSLLGRTEFNVIINGPDLLGQGQQGNWTAVPINCGGTITSYHWYKRPFTTSYWSDTGNTSSSYSSTISVNTNLRCDVVCNGVTKSGYLNVHYDNGQLLYSTAPATFEAVVYPNPFTNELTISGVESGTIGITIHDNVGKIVVEKQVDVDTQTNEVFKTDGWKPGFYFVKMINANGQSKRLKIYKKENEK